MFHDVPQAFGSHGAIVLSDDAVRSYLINFARSFIYTTALPLQGYEKVLAILESELFAERRADLKAIISKFDQKFPGNDSSTPIKILDGYSVTELREVEQKASQINLALKAIFSPTVPDGQECIRVTLHAYNKDADLTLLKGILEK